MYLYMIYFYIIAHKTLLEFFLKYYLMENILLRYFNLNYNHMYPIDFVHEEVSCVAGAALSSVV